MFLTRTRMLFGSAAVDRLQKARVLLFGLGGVGGSAAEALAVMKEDLKALNSSVTVSQKEHDEVVRIKPLFLVCDYQDEI